MNVGPRCGALLIATSIIAATALGCHRERRQAEQALAAATQAYAALEPKAAPLRRTLADLHRDADALSGEAPAGREFRAKLLAAQEVLGTADARTKWLGGELDAAQATAKTKAELAELADQIAKTSADLDQVGQVALELSHEKPRLERVAALLEAPYERTLPTGYRLKAATAGIEARLLDAVQAPPKKLDPTSWVDFDRLRFAGDGADLDLDASRSQLQNVAEILRAYPALALTIGGFTDGTGAAGRDRKRSAARARAVRTALVQMGVAPARLEARGYGAENPACPADGTDVCRAQNRRVAVRVTAK